MGFWDKLKRIFGGGQAAADVPPAAPPGAAQPVAPTAGVPSAAGAAPRTVTQNAYQANEEILGLSAEEMRRRALEINPYNTAFIGRVDTIPPQSDERTAL